MFLGFKVRYLRKYSGCHEDKHIVANVFSLGIQLQNNNKRLWKGSSTNTKDTWPNLPRVVFAAFGGKLKLFLVCRAATNFVLLRVDSPVLPIDFPIHHNKQFRESTAGSAGTTVFDRWRNQFLLSPFEFLLCPRAFVTKNRIRWNAIPGRDLQTC